MAIVTTTEMFKKAYEGGYAIGAFNINNMEIGPVSIKIDTAPQEEFRKAPPDCGLARRCNRCEAGENGHCRRYSGEWQESW